MFFESLAQFFCGGWDLNPHAVASTRSLVLLVCQFRHLRIRDFSENAKVIITYLFSFSTIIFMAKLLFTVFETPLAKKSRENEEKYGHSVTIVIRKCPFFYSIFYKVSL